MVAVPERAAPVAFADTAIVTDPFPVPDAPLVTEIQSLPAVAVHEQLAPVVTDTDTLAPATTTEALVGAIENTHGGGGAGAALCDTVKVWPAIVSVPLRAGPSFAATENATEPLPVPDAPFVILIHAAPDAAVQVHPAPAVTVTVPLAPGASTAWLVGEIE